MAECNNTQNQQNNSQNYRRRNKNPNHIFRKRKPQKPEVEANVFYVSTQTSTKALFEQCSKLLNSNENEIIIYCLGAAIQRGILLTLQLCEKYIAYQFHSKTFSTTLIDDLEPAVDSADYEMQRRFNSALRIRVFRSDIEPATPTDTKQ